MDRWKQCHKRLEGELEMLSYKVPVLHIRQYSAIWRELKLFKMYISKPVTITKNILKVNKNYM